MNYRIILDSCEVNLGQRNLFFRGYINYNGKLLYDADAEQEIANLLNDQTPNDLFNSINGAFRFIYLIENKLYFSIDHFGGYALFYQMEGGNLVLTDNPMLLQGKQNLLDKAVCAVLATGFTLGQDTVFANILECMPGTLYHFDLVTGKLECKKWFNYFSVNERSLDYTKLSVILHSLFPETAKGEYTLSLSGGIDSRVLLGCLLKKEKPFQTYSFGSDLNQDKHIAAKLASQFGFTHHHHNFTRESCTSYFNDEMLNRVYQYCTQGRSIPNETDLISSSLLDKDNNIIVKGFGGDWLTGRYITPALRKISEPQQMTRYLFDKYFHLTAISSGTFRNLLWKQFDELMTTKYYPNHPGLISAEEQWNQHHNERKYIINTLSCYNAKGFRFYLPFYDRRLMNFFAKLKFSEKTDQEVYFTYVRKCLFTEKLSPLRELPTLRNNFLTPFEPNVFDKSKAAIHTIIRYLDAGKIRKRFFLPALSEYADSLMLFNRELKTTPFLRNRIGKNYPDVTNVAEKLKLAGCHEAAKHLLWLSKQSTSQININGVAFCRFFLHPEFVKYLNEHVS